MLKRNVGCAMQRRRGISRVEWASSGRVALAVAASIAAAGAVRAQTAPPQTAAASSQLDEIVVTATRRAESIQDVPISITAFSQEKMDIQGIKAIDDIARLAPGIQFTRGGGGSVGSDLAGTSISIRGISSSAGDSTTGIYIDDTPIQVGATVPSGNFADDAFPQVFDLQRVEVLRGPQGTLFGSASEGGTVRFITPPPNMSTPSMYVRSEMSQTQYGAPSYEAGVAGGAPIIQDTLGFRASVWTRRDGGYVDAVDYYTGQVTSPNNNWQESMSGRLAIGWAPVDGLMITPSVFYQKIKANGSSTFFLPGDGVTGSLNPGDPPLPPVPQPYGNPSRGQYVDLDQVPAFSNQRLTLPALKIDYQFAKMELVSNTSYYERQEQAQANYTLLEGGLFGGTPFPPDPEWNARATSNQTNRFFTQEVRLQSNDADSALKWVTGIFYANTTNKADITVADPHLGEILNAGVNGPCGTPDQCVLGFSNGVPLVNGVDTFINNATISQTQKAAFAQVDYQLPFHLIATAGVRYTKMTTGFFNEYGGPGQGAVWPAFSTANSGAHELTPKYMLAWKNDGVMVYASATKGFRAGGANPALTQPQCFASLPLLGIKSVPTTYNPDTVWSYELGSKFTTDRGRLTIDASVFQINWNNQIQDVGLPTCILSYITNIGTARSRGFDLDVQYRVLDPLVLSLNSGYQYVEATSTIKSTPTDPTSLNVITKGDALPGSQPVVNAAAQYSFQLFERPSYFRVDYNYTGRTAKGASWNPQDSSYLLSPNTQAFLYQTPSSTQTNVRLGEQFGSWDVSLFCNNLLNYQRYLGWSRNGITFNNIPSDLVQASTLRPRTAGVTATMRF